MRTILMTIIMFQLLSLLLSSLLLQTNNNTSSTMNMVCSALYLQPGIQPPPGGGAHHHNTSPIKKKKTTTTTTEQLLCEQHPSLPIITNDGETIPTKVIEYTEKQKMPTTTTTNKIRGKDEEEGRHFWLDRLGTDSMKLVQEQLIMTNRGDSNTTTTTNSCFSLLSWNILCESYYHRKEEKCSNNYIPWSLRSQSILQILENADSDIVCLQEVDYDWFHAELLPNMMTLGYDGVVQGKKTNGTSNDDTTSTNNTNNNNDHLVVEIKRRKNKSVRAHAVATFWKTNRFEAHPGFQQQQQQQNEKKKTKKAAATTTPTFSFAHMARGRTLTSLLRQKQQHGNDNNTIMNDATAAIMNCHLEGHPRQYAARIRQLQHGMKDLVKYTTTTDDTTASTTTTTTKLNALLVAGDFNCELASSASSVYLERGRVGKRSGLGGVHGTSATWAMPPSVLECDEACAVCNPLLEWNVPLPDDELDSVQPHPFRRNSLLSAYSAVSSSFSRTTDDDDRHYSLHPDDFTYCANPYKPVAGLDQIWYSGSSLQRVALKRVFQTEEERLSVLEHGLPLLLAQQPYYNHPSDHLPIGAVMQWKTTKKQQEQEEQLVELTIAKEQVVRAPKPKSPIMAYAELDRLLVTGPFDSEPQRLEVERILESYTLTINLPDNPKEKPSPEQLVQLKEVRERKQRLLQTASEPTRLVLQRIFQLKKKVAVY